MTVLNEKLHIWINWEPTGLLTHCFSGPVLFESILVFSVSARFSWILSITLCCCTPERSDCSKQTVWSSLDTNWPCGWSETNGGNLFLPGENRDMACIRTYSSSSRLRFRSVWWNLRRGSRRSGWKPAAEHTWMVSHGCSRQFLTL